MTNTDLAIAAKLMLIIINKGYTVAIFDGEEHTRFANGKHHTNDLNDLMKNLNATGEDSIQPVGKEVHSIRGMFFLLYDNGDGMEVISDYSDNDLCNEIYTELEASYNE